MHLEVAGTLEAKRIRREGRCNCTMIRYASAQNRTTPRNLPENCIADQSVQLRNAIAKTCPLAARQARPCGCYSRVPETLLLSPRWPREVDIGDARRSRMLMQRSSPARDECTRSLRPRSAKGTGRIAQGATAHGLHGLSGRLLAMWMLVVVMFAECAILAAAWSAVRVSDAGT